MASYSLQADIATLEQLQKKVVDRLIEKQSSFQQVREKIRRNKQKAAEQLAVLRSVHQQFASECKIEWAEVYNQLLQLFTRVVEVYQIKISKLEEEIVLKNMRIQELETDFSQVKYSENGSYEFLFDPPKLLNCNEQQQMNIFNSKRVKISDVIAQNHSKSISTLLYDHGCSELAQNLAEGSSLKDATENLNKNPLNQIEENIKMKNTDSQHLWEKETSPILTSSQERQISPKEKHRKFSQQIGQENKENSMLFSVCKTNKKLQSWKTQSYSSSMKLNQLRKTLIQRRKPQALF